jgi:parallel beta-helix repeat protein
VKHGLYEYASVLLLIVAAVFAFTPIRRVLASNYADVSVADAKAMIDEKPNIVILDVRNQSEYDAGHIRNARLIPVWQLESRLNELNKNDEILVYCKSGFRSAEASLTLADNGFSRVYNMLGGIIAWINATYPVYVKYSSIQEAIDNATAGDTLRVSSGTYYENLWIIGKPVSLEGENKATTVIDGNEDGTVINVIGSDIIITSLTIQNSGCACADLAGIYLKVLDQNVSVIDNNIVNNGYGIKLVRTTNVTIDHNSITNSSVGIELAFSSGTSITNNYVAYNGYGIELNPSSDGIMKGNNITANQIHGVMIRSSSSGNILRENEMTHSEYGVRLYSSFNNSFAGNVVADNIIGIDVQNATDNSLFQNSFKNNSQHVQFFEQGLTNTWDNGNVTGGNYWDNYTGVDSDHDGLGDSPQILDSSNQDNYPLVGMFSAFQISDGNALDVTSNSTVEDAQYFASNNTIMLRLVNATDNQSDGFCRLTIPHSILPPPYTVTVNDNPISYSALFENATISVIYFSYQHSMVEVIVVPEYPWFMLPAIMVATTLLSLIFCRRKRRPN